MWDQKHIPKIFPEVKTAPLLGDSESGGDYASECGNLLPSCQQGELVTSAHFFLGFYLFK